MKDKPFVLLLKPDEEDEFGCFVTCTIRYALGRESYMPKLVTDFLRKHPEMLNAKTIDVAIRDIEQAKNEPLTEWEVTHGRSGLGLDYQRVMWLDFQNWLKKLKEEKNG